MPSSAISSYQLVAQTEAFVVINKASGVSVHRDQAECGLVMQVERDLGCKLWLVHRLDRITSGLLVLARSAADCAALAERFRQREVNKFYLALSDRKPVKKQGQVIGDMARGRRGSWKLLRSRENPAITEFYSCSGGSGVRVLLCKPFSGQTHQIRVALKSVGAPIIGDPIYHEAQTPAPDRGYLHAWQLAFELGGQHYRYRAEPLQGELFQRPEVCQAMAHWGDAWALVWRFAASRGQAG